MTMFGDAKPFINLHPEKATAVNTFAMAMEVSPNFRGPFNEAWSAVRQNGKQIQRYPLKLHLPHHSIHLAVPTEKFIALTLGQFLQEYGCEARSSVFVFGLSLSPETPLPWMFDHLTYADGALHIVVA